MKLDKVDLNILYNLDYDARIPLSQLAKKVKLSKQNLNYRLNKLKKSNIILSFVSVIDIHKLGYLTYRTYFRFKDVDEQKEKELIKYFREHENVLWFVSSEGIWDLEVVITARNFIHFNNLLKKIKEDYGTHFSKYEVSSSIFNYHFKRDYLVNKRRDDFIPKYYGFEPEYNHLDDLDVNIIVALSKNCRQSNQKLGNKLGVSYNTIKKRIQNLEEKKVIQSHRTHLNIQALGREYYKAYFSLNNPSKEQEKRLYSYASQFNSVVYLVEVLGQWQFEIEAEVGKQKEFMEILKKIRNEFPDLILDYNFLLVTKEHKLNYLPMGKNILDSPFLRK